LLTRFLILGLSLLAPAVHADNSAHQWLAKINDAAESLSYEGVFVYLHDGRMEAMRVVRAVNDGAAKERLYSLNGEAREIIRDREQLWCYLPGRKIGVHEYRKAVDSSFPSLLPDDISGLDENYEISVGRRARIADRITRLISIVPRDAYRYGYNLWADVDSGLLLKADLINGDGEPIEQYMFTHVAIGAPIPAADLKPRTPKGELVWHGEQGLPGGDAAPAEGWTVAKVPAGYRLTASIIRMMPMRNAPVLHLVYSDGLSTVSVFIERLSGKGLQHVKGLSRMGAVHAFGDVVDGHQITVVGEVPAATVDLMGHSVRRTTKGAAQ
jgi:sigma-E factor negative regulatory protein RseB